MALGIDIVIDTNVLAHASNPQEKRRAHAVSLISRLLDGSTHLCVDEGFRESESSNGSHIFAEYRRLLPPGSLGRAFVAKLAGSQRIKQLPRKAATSASQKINQLIAKRTDLLFVCVAYNSAEKLLISHDFVDFQLKKRKLIGKELGVAIVEAANC